MAEAAAAPAEGAAAPAGGKKAGLLLIGAAVGGIALGGALAALVLAPKIIARQAPPAGAEAAGAEGEKPAEEEGKEGEGGPAKMVTLENIIVNPAGSQGNRFLMTSVAFGVGDEALQKKLDESKVELRDKVTGVLESMTMAQLTALGARDTIKSRIGGLVQEMLGPKARVKIFLPQFVLQ